MKGKKILAMLISLALMIGSASSVFGAEMDYSVEDLFGNRDESTVGEEYNPEDMSGDESLSDLIESERAAEELGHDESMTSLPDESTDAVPETVDEAVSEEAADENDTDESLSDLSSDTESLTDSLDDSSMIDERYKQETVIGSTYTSAVPEDGKVYYIRCAVDKKYVLTVQNKDVYDKANVVISKLDKSFNQKFMCRKLADGTFVFSNFYSGKSLRIEGSTATNFANIWQLEYKGAGSGRWKLLKNSDGSYRIASVLNTNYVMDIYAGSITDNNNVDLYKWNKTAAQKFVFSEAPIPNYEGTKQLRPSYATTMCAAPASMSSRSGIPISLRTSEDLKVLTYTAIRYNAGYYVLVNRSNGLALTVNGKAAEGTTIVQKERDNSFRQQWLIRVNSNGTYTFMSRLNSNYVITVENGSKKAGTHLVLSTYKNYLRQKFYITIFNGMTIPSGEVYIRSLINTDRVVDVTGANTADGTNIDCYDWNITKAQRFQFVSVTHGGKKNYWFKILSTFSGKVLQVAGNHASSGANIELGTYTGANGQLWHPDLRGDGTYLLRSALNTNLVMDMGGSEAYGVNVHLSTCANVLRQKWYLTPVRIMTTTISATDHSTVTVTANASVTYSDSNRAYLFAVSPYAKTLSGYTPIASAVIGKSYNFHVPLRKGTSSCLLQRKIYIATLVHGEYTVISNPFYIQNPEAAAVYVKPFPTAKRGTKKGIKTGADSLSLAKNLNCSHVVLDLPIDPFLNGNGIAYKYEGKTYHFSSLIDVYRDRIMAYNNAGIVVTGILYLYDSSNTLYMYPAAASGSRRGSATLYALNTRNMYRKRLEALFSCLADRWCKNGCTLANWIYGNELQQYNVYHYAGDISYSQYHEVLAEEFRMFTTAIKSRWKYARTYISLDHNWNLGWDLSGSYKGLLLTHDFNNDLKRQGLVHWDMAMHPYPSPEQDCRFWKRAFTVEDSGAAQQITMLNARYFAAYIKNTYGTSTHIIMSETGLSSICNGQQLQGEQAASVALAYYLAEFDSNIDMLAIHRDYDNSGETSAGWWLGIYYSSGSPKPSADVFKYMDTKNWNSHVSHYMNSYIGSNWKSLIHGFTASFFTNK